MRKPTIHLNGTSREELQRQYEAAYCALDAALTPVRATAPNGRDYYPQGDGAIEAAQGEHVARLLALDVVQRDLETLLAHVLEA